MYFDWNLIFTRWQNCLLYEMKKCKANNMNSVQTMIFVIKKKILLEMGKMLVISIFSFFHYVFKSYL